ncbi:MAG: 1,4-alpha-glucan branching protein GlgB [Bacteroidota bacterium]
MPHLTKDDFYFWNQGSHTRAYEKLGAHPQRGGTWFAVWAPNADYVAVVGSFNGWSTSENPLKKTDAGLWEGFVRGAKPGDAYKYHIGNRGATFEKTDPYAFALEAPDPDGHPIRGLSSIVTEIDGYAWQDADWMANRKGPETLGKPLSIYEVHLGSWMHKQHSQSMSYREIAEPLADHVEKLGFTHVELMPVQEHPYYGSWGYQVVGYFAPTHRYGSPEDFMYFVDTMHRRGIGVLLDWVPAHFATDPQGLGYFDGSPLYEYEDPIMRIHPDWGTYVFDYHKPGVKNFLVSNACFWFDKYHIDGLRFDAVASMLYRDYSRGNRWTPNMFGGRENLEAIDTLKQINETVYAEFPTAIMVAEESTAWPGVSRPTFEGGLGFLYKWNMGWMHDTLTYASKDPVYRQYDHHNLTFPFVYAFSERYALPLSHDEVVHGKGSIWGKMPGDPWQKAANMRLLYGHMVGHPGKKLLFMGQEWGQRGEWSHDNPLSWEQADEPLHAGVQRWTEDLFHLYREHPALWNDDGSGFYGIVTDDNANSVLAYTRTSAVESVADGEDAEEPKRLLFVFNFTPVPRENYRVGIPLAGRWREVINSDSEQYGGSNLGNAGGVEAVPIPSHGLPNSLVLTLPPLGVTVFEWEG